VFFEFQKNMGPPRGNAAQKKKKQKGCEGGGGLIRSAYKKQQKKKNYSGRPRLPFTAGQGGGGPGKGGGPRRRCFLPGKSRQNMNAGGGWAGGRGPPGPLGLLIRGGQISLEPSPGLTGGSLSKKKRRRPGGAAPGALLDFPRWEIALNCLSFFFFFRLFIAFLFPLVSRKIFVCFVVFVFLVGFCVFEERRDFFFSGRILGGGDSKKPAGGGRPARGRGPGLGADVFPSSGAGGGKSLGVFFFSGLGRRAPGGGDPPGGAPGGPLPRGGLFRACYEREPTHRAFGGGSPLPGGRERAGAVSEIC